MEAGKSNLMLGSLDVETSLLMICDLQTKFRPAIHCFDTIVQNSATLLKGCHLLNVPAVATEQYPKGLGSTVEELPLSGIPVFPKTQFTMMVPEVKKHIEENLPKNLKTIILIGIEAHVCVEQTAIDLIAAGYIVHVVADCCSSRSQENRVIAFRNLERIGCFLTTMETVLFKLLKHKNHEKFKDVTSLVRTLSQPTGLTSCL